MKLPDLKLEIIDYWITLGIYLAGLIGVSSYYIYHTWVPIYPPWDEIVFAYPLLTWTDLAVLLIPGTLWLFAYVYVVSNYLDSRRGGR